MESNIKYQTSSTQYPASFQIPFHLSLHVSLLGGFPLIMEFLAFAETYFELGVSFVVYEHAEGHYGKSFFFYFGMPFSEFFFLQQQFTVVYGRVAGIACVYIFGYVEALQPQLATVEKAIAVIEAYLAVSHRFYFGACEHNTGFQPVFDGIFISSWAVFYVNFVGQYLVVGNLELVISNW